MTENTITIAYSDDLLLSLKKSPDEFETEARLLLAIKLHELNRVSTGMAAQLAGISRPTFLMELARFGVSPLGQEAEEIADDYHNA